MIIILMVGGEGYIKRILSLILSATHVDTHYSTPYFVAMACSVGKPFPPSLPPSLPSLPYLSTYRHRPHDIIFYYLPYPIPSIFSH